MSVDFGFSILVDTSQGTMAIDELTVAADEFAKAWELEYNTTKREIQDIDQTTDIIVAAWQRKQKKILSEMRRTVNIINASIGVVRSVLDAVGVTLSPLQSAMIVTLQSALQTVIATQALLAAGTAGIGASAAAILSAVATSISFVAMAHVATGMNEATDQLNKSKAVMDSVQSLVMSFTGGIG